MFRSSKIKRPDTCPVPEDVRIYLERSFLLLLGFFNRQETQQRKILTPHYNDFPVRYDGSEASAFKTLQIIAGQMQIPFEDIHLEFFEEEAKRITSGSIYGQDLHLGSSNNASGPAGLYWGKSDNGQYLVSLVRSKLSQPENMVATLAHELAHIKLLGEERVPHNDERLTDLVTVLFGLGIFNANASFQTFTGIGYSGWQSMGYLKQMEWGYALALLAHICGEQTPAWISHLNRTLQGDFIQSQNYISKNPEKIFTHD